MSLPELPWLSKKREILFNRQDKDSVMSLVKVESLSKSFGNIQAVKNLDLEVEEGEIVGLIGPNGAGKSTTIKCITGQIERDSGVIEVLGHDPEDDPVKLKRELGILPEREDPPSFLTGSEYLEYVSDIRDSKIDSEKWTSRLNMDGKMDKLTYDLSKGERQKLMIIQAFFHKPKLAFIDEPLINLDPIIQEEVKKIFSEAKQEGASVVLSTHVISLAEEICDRVYFLKDGHAEEVEEVENLKQKFLDQE